MNRGLYGENKQKEQIKKSITEACLLVLVWDVFSSFVTDINPSSPSF